MLKHVGGYWLLTGILGVPGTDKRSTVSTFTGSEGCGVTSVLPGRRYDTREQVSRETNSEASDGNVP